MKEARSDWLADRRRLLRELGFEGASRDGTRYHHGGHPPKNCGIPGIQHVSFQTRSFIFFSSVSLFVKGSGWCQRKIGNDCKVRFPWLFSHFSWFGKTGRAISSDVSIATRLGNARPHLSRECPLQSRERVHWAQLMSSLLMPMNLLQCPVSHGVFGSIIHLAMVTITQNAMPLTARL